MSPRSLILAMGAVQGASGLPAANLKITKAELAAYVDWRCGVEAKAAAEARLSGSAVAQGDCQKADATMQDLTVFGTHKYCAWGTACTKGTAAGNFDSTPLATALLASTKGTYSCKLTAKVNSETECQKNTVTAPGSTFPMSDGTSTRTMINTTSADCMFKKAHATKFTPDETCGLIGGGTREFSYIPNPCTHVTAGGNDCVSRLTVLDAGYSKCTYPEFRECYPSFMIPADGNDGNPGPAGSTGAPGKAASFSSRSVSVVLAGVSMVAAIMV